MLFVNAKSFPPLDVLADLIIENAPNEDWKRRGDPIPEGDPRTMPVRARHNITGEIRTFGEAQTQAYLWSQPEDEKFVGFVLAASEVRPGFFAVDALPVIRRRGASPSGIWEEEGLDPLSGPGVWRNSDYDAAARLIAPAFYGPTHGYPVHRLGEARARETVTAEDLWQRMLRGKRVVVSDRDMEYFEHKDDPAIRHLRSIPNPDRVGILDAYVAWIG